MYSKVNLSLVILFVSLVHKCTPITSSEAVKRQSSEEKSTPAVPAEDLLPPPALSASFPTLRPHVQGKNPPPPINVNTAINPPARDLIPPSRPGPSPPKQTRPPFPSRPQGRPSPQQSRTPQGGPRPLKDSSPPGPAPVVNDEKLPLLPPIEIPPERPIGADPLTAQTSFIPTTGQGAGQLGSSAFIVSDPAPPIIPAEVFVPASANAEINNPSNGLALPQENNGGQLSTVRFPDSERPSQIPTNCPTCECTSEVDYICGSNGVVYLNSCSFDCATVCHEGLRKVEVEFCSPGQSQ